MTIQDFKRWKELHDIAFQDDSFITDEAIKERLGYDYVEFVRLNFDIMERVHEVHNLSMRLM